MSEKLATVGLFARASIRGLSGPPLPLTLVLRLTAELPFKNLAPRVAGRYRCDSLDLKVCITLSLSFTKIVTRQTRRRSRSERKVAEGTKH